MHFAALKAATVHLTAVIDVHSFGFTYPGSQRPAVRDVAFSVEPGEIFGFLGPSGAGKSTTQNVLIRLLDGYEGHVAVLGKDLRAWDRGYYRRIGVAFESPNHYLKLTARENLQLFAWLHGGATEDPRALLEHVGLEQDGDNRGAPKREARRWAGRDTLRSRLPTTVSTVVQAMRRFWPEAPSLRRSQGRARQPSARQACLAQARSAEAGTPPSSLRYARSSPLARLRSRRHLWSEERLVHRSATCPPKRRSREGGSAKVEGSGPSAPFQNASCGNACPQFGVAW